MKQIMKVSVLVSTYNWPEALECCVRSIFAQTVMPYEIVIADDGSSDKTAKLVKELQKESPIPITHVWHEDKGFRKTIILNKAIASITGDYILQVDGDVVLSRHFVSDHLELAEKNCFVCGSRVKLDKDITARTISTKRLDISPFHVSLKYVLNSCRSRILRHLLASLYANKLRHWRGCNMAFWRDDVIRINGYNENFWQWGHEDAEFGLRLHFAGVKKKTLKMGGCVYHLHHKWNSKNGEQRNLMELQKVKDNHLSWCDNGIDKYLI